MARNIAGCLAAAGGVANMDGVPQIEMGDDCRDIGSIVVHVVAGADLCRAAVAAPVMSDHAVALFDEVEHLRVPIVGAQWPSVMEENRLPGTPVFVEDLDAVFGGDRAHNGVSVHLVGGWRCIGKGRRVAAEPNRYVPSQHDALYASGPTRGHFFRAMPSCSDS